MTMHNQQTVIVNNRNGGCLSGCGTVFVVLVVLGLAIEYWYVAVPVAAVAGAVALYVWYQREQSQLPAPVPEFNGRVGSVVPSPAGVAAASHVAAAPAVCGRCGGSAPGNFCAHCGAARTRMCSSCGRVGLTSDFCPDCGSATYVPPVP
jgi:hypothetical protein